MRGNGSSIPSRSRDIVSESGKVPLMQFHTRHVGDEFRIILDAHTPAVDVCLVLGVLFITSLTLEVLESFLIGTE
ncbi:hypothetical protein CEXT_308981 [Caerostris extrusa]|uniref:Uncharacterized protein n=1 Tax=Caerostris extrusa TaxID=172846 RepID=A0AAV4P458_CAEEX|nr:hypothetical protein CEXT_308981 [Caerostris extrusa]